MTKVFTYPGSFLLESGASLPRLELACTQLGDLAAGKKIVWIFHALTATGNPLQWWDGLVGEGKLFNENDFTIISVNLPGSCYGSTGPLSVNPETGEPYYHSFPVFTVKDMVKAFQFVRDELGIQKIDIGIGSSMGGQHLLQWAVEEPGAFDKIIPIACNAQQSAWSLAIDAAQRLAIEADPTWKENRPDAGVNGMKAARAMAMIQYRTYESFAEKNQSAKGNAESYQRHQARKIGERFNAFSYYNLSLNRATYDLAKGYGDVQTALKKISALTLVIGISSDGLFPLPEQKLLAQQIPGAQLAVIDSMYGHDAFLVEYGQLEKMIRPFLQTGFAETQTLKAV